MDKEEKKKWFGKQEKDFVKINGDLAYIDPISGERVTFEAIEKRKAKARANAEKILKRMGFN